MLHEIKTDFPRPSSGLGHMEVFESNIDKSVEQGLLTIASKHRTTLFTVLHAVLALLIFRWSGQQHIVVGSPVLGRNIKETEAMMGCFINTLVINNEVNEELQFDELVESVSKTIQQAMDNQELPFERLVESIDVKRNFGVNPVFQIMLALQNDVVSQEKFHDLTLHASSSNHTEAKMDLTLNAVSSNRGLHLSWQYANSLFSAETISSFARTFEYLITQIIEQPTAMIKAYQLVHTNRSIKAPVQLPKGDLLPINFINSLEFNKEKCVLSDENKSWSASQTLAFMKQVQSLCNKHQICRGDVVIIAFDKCNETYALIYALWSLGIIYVPCSSAIPAARARNMIEQVKANFAFVKNKNESSGLPESCVQLDINDIAGSEGKAELITTVEPTDLAYILFTSGTTGEAKGVCVTHANVTCLIASLNEKMPAPNMRLAIDSPLIFDASLASIGLLSQGHRFNFCP